MKKALIYLLILILSIPIISPLGTITYFVINQDYIKDVYCENKSRPELQCNGKCYLAKKIKQQKEAAEKEALESIKELSWAWLYCQDLDIFDFRIIMYLYSRVCWSGHADIYHNSFSSGIFRPPRG